MSVACHLQCSASGIRWRVCVVYVRLRILRHSLFEKVGLSGERYHVHEVERVGRAEYLRLTKPLEKMIRYELYILAHKVRVHPDHLHRE